MEFRAEDEEGEECGGNQVGDFYGVAEKEDRVGRDNAEEDWCGAAAVGEGFGAGKRLASPP